MIKKSDKSEAETERPVDEDVRLLYDHIMLVCLNNARVIFESQKPETLLKMIQSCKEIQPVNRSNEELWKTVQKVRQEVFGTKAEASPKPALSETSEGSAVTSHVHLFRLLRYVVVALSIISAHAAADSLVVQGQNSAGIYDTKMYQNYDDINFGSSQTLTVLNLSGLNRRSLFKFTNMDTVGMGKVIDSMAIDLYCTSQAGAIVGMFELWKDWYEGNSDNAVESGAADDTHWRHNDSAWTKEMADSVNDHGAQNRLSGTGADRKATAMTTVTVSASPTWYRFRVGGDLAQDWYDGIKQPYGVIFVEIGTNGSTVFASSENATTANRPKVTIYYHTAVAETSSRRRLFMLTTNQ